MIEDNFAFSGDLDCENKVILSFMTCERPVLQEHSDSLLFTVGALGRLDISGAALSDIEKIPVTDKRLKTAWEHEIYRILVTAVKNKITMRIF